MPSNELRRLNNEFFRLIINFNPTPEPCLEQKRLSCWLPFGSSCNVEDDTFVQYLFFVAKKIARGVIQVAVSEINDY